MIVEGVTFIEEEVKKWKRKDFIDVHKKVFFQNSNEMDREKKLGEIYDEIVNQKVPISREFKSSDL